MSSISSFDLTRRPLAPYIFIALLGCIAFGSTLKVGFLWDDHEMIEKNMAIKDLRPSNVKYLFTHDAFDGKGDSYYRPLQLLTYTVDKKIWGLRPFGFHLTNLLLQLANGCLLLFLLRRLLDDALTPFFTALLFVVHPIIVEQLLIVAGRAELMSMTFMLAGLCLSLKQDAKNDLLSLACYAAACFSKESGIVYPGFLFLIGILNPAYKRGWKMFFACALVAVAYIGLRTVIVPVEGATPPIKGSAIFAVHDLPTIVVTYLRILFFPVDLHSHRRMLFRHYFLFASPLILGGILGFAALRRSRLWWFSIGWFIVGFLPKLPLLANNSLMLDHWAYLSVLAVCLLVAHGLSKLVERNDGRRLVGAMLFIGMLSFWLCMSVFFCAVRGTDKKMYEWALRFPTSSIVRYNMALIDYEEGRYPEAKHLLEESLSIRPDSPPAANLLALVLWKEGEPRKGLDILAQWIEKNPEHLQSYVNRAVILGDARGLPDLDRALEKNPLYQPAWFTKGDILLRIGDVAKAKEAFERLAAINPGDQRATNALRYIASKPMK